MGLRCAARVVVNRTDTPLHGKPGEGRATTAGDLFTRWDKRRTWTSCTRFERIGRAAREARPLRRKAWARDVGTDWHRSAACPKVLRHAPDPLPHTPIGLQFPLAAA